MNFPRGIIVTLDQACIDRLKKDGGERIELPELGVLLDIIWSNEQIRPTESKKGSGCFAEVTKS